MTNFLSALPAETLRLLLAARDLLAVILLSIVVAAILFTLVNPASAQMLSRSSPSVQAAIESCSTDREKHCATVMPGGGRILRCLVEKSDLLSPNCRSALERVQAEANAAGLSAR